MRCVAVNARNTWNVVQTLDPGSAVVFGIVHRELSKIIGDQEVVDTSDGSIGESGSSPPPCDVLAAKVDELVRAKHKWELSLTLSDIESCSRCEDWNTELSAMLVKLLQYSQEELTGR